jgi:thiazole synthase
MDKLIIADREFSSRLFIGTGKYASNEIMAGAIEASGTQMVTVALRRVDIENPNDDLLAAIDGDKYLLLPNTSGARDAAEAVRLAKIARAAAGVNWIKLEVTPDPYYLLPDGTETLKAAQALVADGFVVLPYINADPILAKKLQDLGTATVMPLASPIGSNQGLKTQSAIEIIIAQATVPVVVDAGLGLPSHASAAMEMGADAVLVNTAIATAEDPIQMACAFKNATVAGRLAYLSGPAAQSAVARASSPLTGFLTDDPKLGRQTAPHVEA